MAITNLQQARQMFRYGGDTMGGPNDKSNNNNNNNNGNGRPETTRHNPHTDSGTSKTSTVTGDEMRSAERDFIQTLNTNNAIRSAQTGTKFDAFNNFTPTFAPKQKKGLGIMDLGLMLATGGLFGTKAKTAAQLLDTAKRTKNLVSDLSNTFNFKNPLANIFSDKPKTKSPTTNTIDSTGDGEGLASLENANALQEEYLLLLQKLQTGLISDEEQVRYTMLKNMLGI